MVLYEIKFVWAFSEKKKRCPHGCSSIAMNTSKYQLASVIAFDEGERKPNFVFASCVFRDGVPVYGYAEFFEIAVRTPKWRPRLSFAGACVGRETGANL